MTKGLGLNLRKGLQREKEKHEACCISNAKEILSV